MKTIKEHGLPELKIEIDDKGLRTQEASAELIVTDGETFFHDFYDERSGDFYNKNIVKYIRVDEIEGLLERYNKSQEALVPRGMVDYCCKMLMQYTKH